jgi:alpha-1,6-mannosyltransferase
MFLKIVKSQIALIALAVVIALILCLELAIRGYDYYGDILAQTRAVTDDYPNRFIQFRIGLEYIILNAIYLLWLVKNRQRISFRHFGDLLKATSVFLLLALLSYPITTDILLYLHAGLMNLSGINPYLTPAGDFPSQITPFLFWKQTSTYGPISQQLFTISAVFTSLSLPLGVYVFKVFCLTAHLTTSFLIWQQLKNSPYRSILTIAYLVNPFLLFTQVINAHIDVFISLTVTLLVLCLKHQRYLLSILTIWLGFLIKTLPIIWLALVAVFLIRRQRWRSLAIAILLSLAIVGVLSHTALPTLAAWKSLLNPGVAGWTNGSIYSIVAWILGPGSRFLPVHAAVQALTQSREFWLRILRLLMYTGFVGYYIWTLLKIYFKRNYLNDNLSLDIGWITLALFLLVAIWYQPWYAGVLLPIAVLHPSRRFFWTSVTLSLASSCVYYTLGPRLLYDLVTVIPTIAVMIWGAKLWQDEKPVALES